MLNDLEKYKKIRQSNDNLRSVWTVGIFWTEDIEQTQDNFESFLLEQNGEYSIRDLTVAKIGETNYWFVLL